MAKLTIMANFSFMMAKATLTQGLFFANPDGPLAVPTSRFHHNGFGVGKVRHLSGHLSLF
jgi:hypothetical protein